jgi:O-antigen/teichoic acid export membrane protein
MNKYFTLLKNNVFRIKNLSLYLLASIISGVLAVLFNPFLAANLSSTDYSIIGYYASFASLFTPILNFSLISFYVRKYFKIPEDKRQLTLDTIITTLLLWGAISTLLILVLFFIYCSIAKVELPFFPFAIMSVTQLFFNNFLLLYQVECRMRSEAKRYFNITMSASLITILLSIILVIALKFGAVGRMSAMLLSSVCIGIFAIKKLRSKFRLDKSILKEAVSFGWPVSCTYIIQYFLVGIDLALLEPRHDVSNMGLYAIAISIAGYLSIFYTALAQTFEPDIYKAVAQYNYKKIFYIEFLIVSILLVIILIFVLFAKPVIALLTANRYTNAYHFARILSIGVVSTYLMAAIEGIINAFGFTKVCLINKIIGSTMAIGIYYYLINSYGFYGGAWGRVVAPLLVFIIGCISLVLLKNRIKTMHYAERKN